MRRVPIKQRRAKDKKISSKLFNAMLKDIKGVKPGWASDPSTKKTVWSFSPEEGPEEKFSRERSELLYKKPVVGRPKSQDPSVTLSVSVPLSVLNWLSQDPEGKGRAASRALKAAYTSAQQGK